MTNPDEVSLLALADRIKVAKTYDGTVFGHPIKQVGEPAGTGTFSARVFLVGEEWRDAIVAALRSPPVAQREAEPVANREKIARVLQGANAIGSLLRLTWDEVPANERDHWLFLADAIIPLFAAPPSRLDALPPIVTAPRDGSEILLVSLQPQTDNTIYISISNGSWSEQEQLFVLGPKGSLMNSIGDACATHWLPVNWLLMQEAATALRAMI